MPTSASNSHLVPNRHHNSDEEFTSTKMDFLNAFKQKLSGQNANENVNDNGNQGKKSTENNEAGESPPSSISSPVPSVALGNCDNQLESGSKVSSLRELEHGSLADHVVVKRTIRKSSRKEVHILFYDSDDDVEEIIDQVGGKYDSNKRTIRKFLKQIRTSEKETPKSSHLQMTGTIASNFDGKNLSQADQSSDGTLDSFSAKSDDKCIQDLYSDFKRNRLHRQVKKVAKASLAVLCVVIVVALIIVAIDLSKPDMDEDTLLAKWGIRKRTKVPGQQNNMTPSKQPSGLEGTSPTGSHVDPSVETPSGSPMKSQTNSPSTSPVASIASPSSSPIFQQNEIQTLMTTFYVIGDLPYNDHERSRLIEHVNNLPDDAEFLIHVGDMRNADEENDCLLSEFDDVANILKKSKVPVLIVPGDNEYNDCPNLVESWGDWLGVFGDLETNWSSPIDFNRDTERPENFFFIYKRVLYIGLNIVGGNLHSYVEWEGRLSHQIEWTKNLIDTYVVQSPSDASSVVIFAHADPRLIHSSFFGPLQDYIENDLKNEIPIIYVNGDKHYFQFDPAWYGQTSFHRVMVEGGSTEPPLQMKLSVPSSPNHGVLQVEDVYTFDRQL